MNWVRALASLLVLGSSTAWGATLTWNADTAPDLAGYRIYQCSQLPCTPTSGKASALATVGTVTSFNIGTPSVTQYYFVTAYDFSNNESGGSNVATYTPAGSPPPAVPPVIGTSPTTISFTATQGGANPATQTLSISNMGGGTLSWTASDNAPWLTVSPPTGTGNGAVMLSVSTGTLTVGSHSSTVTMNASGASSVTVPVTFTIATAPVPPAIGASPTSLSFTATQGGSNPATQNLSISNSGGGSLSWTASDDVPWLRLNRTSGTDSGVMIANVITGDTAAGTYHGIITLNGTGASPVTVPVTFTVVPASVPPPVTPPPAALTPPPTPGGLTISAVQ